MTDQSSGPPHHHPHHETSEERLQHDIEELEGGSGWKGAVKWLIIVGVAVGIVVGLYLISGPNQRPRSISRSSSGGVAIDTLEPPSGRLSMAPMRFKWESVQGRKDYLFRILAKGEPKPLVERPVRENSAVLTSDEASRLTQGRGYIWEVEARSMEGTTLGSGRGFFDL